MVEEEKRTAITPAVIHRIEVRLKLAEEPDRSSRTRANVFIEDAITKSMVARANRILAEAIPQKSCGEAADEIATAQRLIEAGVRNNDTEVIEVGRQIWSEVWPEEIANLHVDLYIKDLREGLIAERWNRQI